MLGHKLNNKQRRLYFELLSIFGLSHELISDEELDFPNERQRNSEITLVMKRLMENHTTLKAASYKKKLKDLA